MSDTRETYEPPAVSDYGDLLALTAGGILGVEEDGADKRSEFHHTLAISP